jgi:phosphoadenosine phosphosulfate reductase
VTDDEKQLILQAQAVPLEVKVRKAILLLRSYEEMAGPDGYYLAFSGGKDSIVIKELARLAGVRFEPVYNQTTIDPPELVRFIREKHPETRWNVPPKNLIMRMEDSALGPPTRVNRWCCKEYKETGGNDRVIIIGVRAAESPRRAATWKQVTANRNGGHIVCPILYWTDSDVWLFIHQQALPYCSLYDEGFTRLGCVGCPMGNQRRDFRRWPGFERLWKIGFQRYWDRWKGVPRRDGKPRWIERLPNVEALWNWWITGERYDPNAGCQNEFAWSGEDEIDAEAKP